MTERLNRAAGELQGEAAKMAPQTANRVYQARRRQPAAISQIESFALLENIPAEALAARLGMTVEVFLEALPDGDEAMLAALLRTAMAAGSAE